MNLALKIWTDQKRNLETLFNLSLHLICDLEWTKEPRYELASYHKMAQPSHR
jgi:hypothetical protein